MSSRDDERALERFVAGLDVEDDALIAAITARALDRKIAVDALLGALTSDDGVLRRRAAERASRMESVAPRVAAELKLIAASDPDGGARAAAATAMAAHGLRFEDEVASGRRSQLGERLLKSLVLKPTSMRADEPSVVLLPREHADAPGTRGRLTVDDNGRPVIVLKGLPEAFAGTRPTLRIRRGADVSSFTIIGSAIAPVADDRVATIAIAPELGTIDEVRALLTQEVELVALDD